MTTKIESKTLGLFADSETDAASKVTVPTDYKIQNVTRIHDNFYHVRLIKNEA
jgi:hypothetical protein